MKKTFLAFVLLTSMCILKAQVNTIPFGQSMDNYQTITGTIIDVPNEDDIFHANIPIGFNFTYNGHTTNKVGICTNGFIVMDSMPHPASFVMSTNNVYQINGLMADLQNTNTNGSIEYLTIGTSPNRVFIAQWHDYSIFGVPFCHLNVQIRLHETSNCIQFVYGTNTLSGLTGRTFYVGLTGDVSTDYNFRTTPNSWLSTIPATSFSGSGNGMLLNALNTIPSGLTYSFGSCPLSGIPFSYITGKVYNDVNNNGIKDAGENGIANRLLHESVQNYYANTDSAGNYAMLFIDSTLAYQITVVPPLYWNISSTPSTYTVTPLSSPLTNKDFGLYATPNVHDVKISSTYSGATWPNAIQHIHTTFSNQGTIVEPGDSIFLIKDSLTLFVSASTAPALVSNDSIVWIYSNLLVNEFRNIHVQLKVDTTVVLGDTLDSYWTIKPLLTDADPSNNTLSSHLACMTSFDPNIKEVMPDGNIFATEKELIYTIHFQNTGTAPAQNIFLYDTLDSNLDISTFKLLGFSHPMTYQISGPGYIRFTFANINLADSTNNEPESHGSVTYSISPKPSLFVGTKIHNTAAIVFDYNTPIITNTTENIIVEAIPNDIVDITSKNENMHLYPNPTNQELLIQSIISLQGANIHVYDITGKMMLNEKLNNTNPASINVSTLRKGIYIVVVKLQNKNYRFKISKQ